MHDIKGFEIRDSLSNWAFLLEEWLFLNEKYCRVYEGGDTLFDYNERTNIGILSSAAWRCGWLSIEEFAWDKTISGEERGGRADMWISENGEEESFIEAKHCKISLNARNFIKNVNDNLDAAYSDAVNSKNNDKDVKSIGVSFSRIYVKQNNSEEELRRKISSYISKVRQIKFDAMGYYFPDKRLESSSADEYSRLGIILLAKRTRKNDL